MTLIASDPRVSAALMVLSVTKMILIYLNYRLWSAKLKDIYGEVLDTLVFDRNLDVFDMYRLFLFLWMFEFIFKLYRYFELENLHIPMNFIIFEAKFKRKKVLSWFMIVFTNSSGYFITLGLNLNNWKWRLHNLWHQFLIWFWYFLL